MKTHFGIAAFLLASSVAAQLPTVPTVPAIFPDATQLYLINDTFLQHPLVTTALDYVKKTVNPTLLNLQPSTYVLFGNVTYPEAQVAPYCKWGNGPQCTRATDTADFKADVLTCPQPNQWGITYDDGPNGATPGTANVRTALKEANIKATFFVLGSAVKLFPALLKAAYDEGHEIAIHSWTHRPMTSLSTEHIVAELKYTEALIYSTIGQVPLFFRPPYGDVDDRVRAIVSALGYRLVIWTTLPDIIRDTQDTTATVQADLAGATANITKWFSDPVNAQRGFISLQHDQNSFTVGFSVAVINAFRTSGSSLKPQPVGTCMGLPSYKTLTNATATTTGLPATVTGGVTSPAGSPAASASASTQSPKATTTSAAGIVTPQTMLLGLLAVFCLVAGI